MQFFASVNEACWLVYGLHIAFPVADCTVVQLVTPDPDGSETICRILFRMWIRFRIQKFVQGNKFATTQINLIFLDI